MYMRKGLGIFSRTVKTGSHPGLNRGSLTLAVSALPPELWALGDSQPSQLSISLCMCPQNPARGGATLSEIFYFFHSSAREAGSSSKEPPSTTRKLRYTL